MNFENYKMPTEVEAGLFALCNQKRIEVFIQRLGAMKLTQV